MPDQPGTPAAPPPPPDGGGAAGDYPAYGYAVAGAGPAYVTPWSFTFDTLRGRHEQIVTTFYQAGRPPAQREPACDPATARDQLHAMLSDQQRADLTRLGFFYVTSSTGRRWRIRAQGVTGNVDLMAGPGRDAAAAASYCFHPHGAWPYERAWLEQAIALAADEAGVLAVANPVMTWNGMYA